MTVHGPLRYAQGERELPAAGITTQRHIWTRGSNGSGPKEFGLYFRDPDGHLVERATPGVWAT